MEKQQCKVAISPNPIKTSERIDLEGNIIDPRTKRIIVPKEPDYVPLIQTSVPLNDSTATNIPPDITPDASQAPPASPIPKDDPMAIQEQIQQAEANLIKLKEAKKAKIEELKRQVELLEKQ